MTLHTGFSGQSPKFFVSRLLWMLLFLTLFTCLLSAQTPPGFKIAFSGDSGIDDNAEAVLTLILNEGTDAVIHAGDMCYEENDTPLDFEDHINAVFGANFPYFYSAGNHDASQWEGANGYRELLEARFNRLGIAWSGDLGTKSVFTYQGFLFVITSPDEMGVGESEAADYVRDQLAANEALWKISVWHKNQRDMQVGDKPDQAGWGVYEESRRGGAIMATAHEHSYSRTYLLSHMEDLTIADTGDTLNLAADDPATSSVDEGRSFAFVSGLGGRSVRPQELFNHSHWAAIYTETQDATYGALFGEFHYDGEADLAHFYFKDIDGNIQDEFFIRAPGSSPLGTDGPHSENLPKTVALYQNYPNPFNPETVIRYQLSVVSETELTVLDILGRQMRTLVNERQAGGRHRVTWNGRNDAGKPVSSGIYYYRLTSGTFAKTRKMLLIR